MSHLVSQLRHLCLPLKGRAKTMDRHDDIVEQIERLRRREDTLDGDIIIAMHKGYGGTGGTEEEIRSELVEIRDAIERLTAELDTIDH